MRTYAVIAIFILALLLTLLSMKAYVNRAYDEGVVALKNGDRENAVKYLRKASRLGSIESRVVLAESYAIGVTFDRDREVAMDYYDRVPDRRMQQSIRSVVYSLKEGAYGPPDEDEAAFWKEQLKDLE